MIEFSEFSVFSVAKNQPKTLIPQSKNRIFQKFLSSFPKTSYERRATRNGYIFVSKVQVALIIEALALEFTQSLSPGVLTRLFCRGVCADLLVCRGSGASGKKQPVIYVPIRHPEGPAN
jgi:hypothetical protein